MPARATDRRLDYPGAADRDRIPVYLETMRESNVGYYAKFGFRTTSEFRCLAGRGPRAWTMVRPAAPG